MTVEISYQGQIFHCEGDYDDVCKAIVDGRSLIVYRWDRGSFRTPDQRITFFSDVDWVAANV